MNPLEKIINPKHSIILSIEKPKVPEKIKKYAQIHNLQEKDEYHISILVTRNAYKIRKYLKGFGDTEAVLIKMERILNSLDWEYTLTDEYFLQEYSYKKEVMEELGSDEYPEHTRRSIIQKIILPDLQIFYEKISQEFNLDLEIPVPHITLFSWSDYEPLMKRGIGISSENDFQEYCVKKLN